MLALFNALTKRHSQTTYGTVKPLMLACSLLREFGEPNKTVKWWEYQLQAEITRVF